MAVRLSNIASWEGGAALQESAQTVFPVNMSDHVRCPPPLMLRVIHAGRSPRRARRSASSGETMLIPPPWVSMSCAITAAARQSRLMG